MYSRQQASELKKEFWTVFGQYMAPVLSAEGEKISWINYKTGEKHIYFKMGAETKTAFVGIELQHPDTDIQQLYFDQFTGLRTIFTATVPGDWIWQLHTPDENGKIISRIFTELKPVNILNKEEWPKLIRFFKPRMIALDEFWSAAKYTFEALR